ncbi:hypothetical protein JB92DRAFT_3140385 [Gautieria morchelliformis]|nr:hypothetical protein JB92DRAFT_3140385 [Gautieria morchelliformis]
MLDNFGKIAVGELVIYPPILCLSVFVALRHGFSPKDAWICLFLFCSVRIVGSVLSIVSQSQSDPSAGLLEAVAIVQALGLSPLLLSTLGFVKTIAEYGGLPSFITRVLHVHVHILVTIGVALAVIGGTKLSPSNSPSSQASGHTLSKAGTACFLVAYITLSGVLVLLWRATERIPQNHRKLLRNLSLVFPVLAVRVLYSVLGAFVPSPSKWSPTTGDWKLYLIMALVMEEEDTLRHPPPREMRA